MEDEVEVVVESVERNEVSLLAKFDDICRGFCVESCDEEFLVFSENQEECRKKWLTVENNIREIQAKLAKEEKIKAKLELQIQHVNVLLKEEAKVKAHIEEDKYRLQKQIFTLREFLKEDDGLKHEMRDQLEMNLNFGRYPHLLQPVSNARPIDKLDTISEVNTVTSCSSTTQSEEELELSTVRSFRNCNSTKLNKRISDPISDCKKAYFIGAVDNDVEMDDISAHRIVATTEVFVSQGSTFATSTLESIPGTSCTNDLIKHGTVRNHCFKNQLVFSQAENCCSCGYRIKFGKMSLKCKECGKTYHVDCQSSGTCTPSKKPKKSVRFFSSPSVHEN